MTTPDQQTPGAKHGPLPPNLAPTPWAYRPEKHDDWGLIRAADGGPVAQTYFEYRTCEEEKQACRQCKCDPEEVEANARLIVEAVNSHASLQAECSRLRSALEDIANPMKKLKAQVDAGVGDIMTANHNCHDSYYLRGLATAALAQSPPQN